MTDLGALTAFVLARLDEEERDARAAQHDDAVEPGVWTAEPAADLGEEPALHVAEDSRGHYWTVGMLWPPIATHVARQDPAATLARVEALRALVADIQSERHYVDDNDCWYTCPAATEERDGGTSCKGDRGDSCDCNRGGRIERRLRHVAAIWRHHEDYDPSWRP